MENDLISRKALIAEYDRVHVGPPGGARKLIEDAPEVKPGVVAEIKIDNDALQRMVDEAVEQIKAELFGNQAPTIEPRAKGHWICHDNADIVEGFLGGFYVPKYECSECHAWKEDDSDYCPDCGADMRGEQDG